MKHVKRNLLRCLSRMVQSTPSYACTCAPPRAYTILYGVTYIELRVCPWPVILTGFIVFVTVNCTFDVRVPYPVYVFYTHTNPSRKDHLFVTMLRHIHYLIRNNVFAYIFPGDFLHKVIHYNCCHTRWCTRTRQYFPLSTGTMSEKILGVRGNFTV